VLANLRAIGRGRVRVDRRVIGGYKIDNGFDHIAYLFRHYDAKVPPDISMPAVRADARRAVKLGSALRASFQDARQPQSVREPNVGLSDLFSRHPRRFVSKEAFETNLEKQMAMTPQTLQQLRKYNVTPEKRLQLEFFFYTNTVENAVALAAELKNRNYKVNYGPSVSNEKVQLITGLSAEIIMSDAAVLDWTREMCTLGFKHDCDFDGWGTNAE
jgi:hypothetical protein